LLWEQIVQSTCDTITPDMRALAKNMGWRQMFLTNNIQLQRQTRKKKQRQENQAEKLA
jgi:F-box protein 36